jgi:hypothetical protein
MKRNEISMDEKTHAVVARLLDCIERERERERAQSREREWREREIARSQERIEELLRPEIVPPILIQKNREL